MRLTKSDVFNSDGTLTEMGREALARIDSADAWDFVRRREGKSLAEMNEAYGGADSALKLNTLTQRIRRRRRILKVEEVVAHSGVQDPELVKHFNSLPPGKVDQYLQRGGYFLFYKMTRQPWTLVPLEASDDDEAVAEANDKYEDVLWNAARAYYRKNGIRSGVEVLALDHTKLLGRINRAWKSAQIHYFVPETVTSVTSPG